MRLIALAIAGQPYLLAIPSGHAPYQAPPQDPPTQPPYLPVHSCRVWGVQHG